MLEVFLTGAHFFQPSKDKRKAPSIGQVRIWHPICLHLHHGQPKPAKLRPANASGSVLYYPGHPDS